jgi:Rhs element Vgr protein
MPIVRDLSKAQIAFQVSGQPLDKFDVVRYRGSEGLCQLYRFEIDLVADGGALPLADLVGKTATLSVNTDTGERWFHGIVGRAEITGEAVGQTYYRAELVPNVWLLNHRYHSRIFQGKTTKEIISAVLTEGGIASDHVKFMLEGSYTAREYCVQYRETDYNFITRLMEEEGIWWCFEHSKESHVLIIADSASAYAPIPDDAKLIFRPPSGLLPNADHVFRFRIAEAVRPGAVILNDYSFENPALKLEAKDDAGRDETLEFCDFPGEFAEQDRGTALAKLRKEEFQATRVHAAGQSNCKRIAPGRTFELDEHTISTLNGNYLVVSVTHEGKQAVTHTTTGSSDRGSVLDARLHQSLLQARTNDNQAVRDLAESLLQIVDRLRAGDPTARRALAGWLYHAGQVARELPNVAVVSGGSPTAWLSIPNLIEDVARSSVVDYDAPIYQNSFDCIPATVTYRPPRVTPWPAMRGTQTARVVGPSGEEIHTDKYGRVRVQFDWDRQGNEGGQPKLFGADSSCWIRVCQGMAGGAYGMMFIPRVGQEVIVDFLEGDPDKPIVIGRVYNADLMPPYELPKEKTKSVIKTHSSKGGGGCNEIRFEDLKDKEQLFIQAQRQMDTRVKADHFHTVGGSYHLIVGGDDKGEYREQVEKAKHVHVKGEVRTWTEGDESRQVDGKVSVKIKGTCSTDISSDVVDKFGANHKHEVTQTYACKAMSIKLEASMGIELKCGGSSIVLTPAAIFIVGGPLVNINSGSGPPVAPVTAGATAPQQAEDPSAADQSKPGKDVTYTGGEELKPAEGQAEVAGHEWKEEEAKEKETTWIDIELVDEEGQPVPGAAYRVTDSQGKVKEGTLDANGHAHVTGISPGEAQITFPNLDQTAWQRTA